MATDLPPLNRLLTPLARCRGLPIFYARWRACDLGVLLQLVAGEGSLVRRPLGIVAIEGDVLCGAPGRDRACVPGRADSAKQSKVTSVASRRIPSKPQVLETPELT